MQCDSPVPVDDHFKFKIVDNINDDFLDEGARDAFLQHHGTGVALPDRSKVLPQRAQARFIGRRERSASIVQIAQHLLNALLLCQLRVPALLQYLGH